MEDKFSLTNLSSMLLQNQCSLISLSLLTMIPSWHGNMIVSTLSVRSLDQFVPLSGLLNQWLYSQKASSNMKVIVVLYLYMYIYSLSLDSGVLHCQNTDTNQRQQKRVASIPPSSFLEFYQTPLGPPDREENMNLSESAMPQVTSFKEDVFFPSGLKPGQPSWRSCSEYGSVVFVVQIL